MGRIFTLFLVIAGAAIFLFAPIVQEFNVFGDLGSKKLAFSLYLFGFVKLAGGYVTSYRGGVAVHPSEKKAVLLPYSGMNEERKKFKIFRSFRLISLETSAETGAEYFAGAAVTYAALKSFLALKGALNKSELKLYLTDGDALKVSVRVVAYFQIAVLLALFVRFLIKTAIRRIKEIWKKEKSTV